MSLRRKIHEEIPTTDRVQRVPLTEEGTARLKAKANRVGCPPGQLVRQGIDWIVDLVGKGPGHFLDRAREPSPLCREIRPSSEDGGEDGSENGSECDSKDGSGNGNEYSTDEKSRPFAVTLRPARVAGLKETALDVATAVGGKGGTLPFSQEGSPGRHGPTCGTEPGAGWAALTERLTERLLERLVQEAARWVAESLRAKDIRAGGSSSRQASFSRSPPGRGEAAGASK